MRLIERFARPRQRESLPVALDRRRIYVLPTRFGLFFCLLVGTMCIGALNYNNNPALLLGLLLGGAGLASLIATHLQITGIEALTLAAEPVAAGEPLRLRIAFTSPVDRPRAGLRLRIDDVDSTFSFKQHHDAVAEIDLPTKRRGWIEIERIEISSARPLGLARAWAWLRPDRLLLVYPAIETDGPPLPENPHDGEHRRPHFSGDDMHMLRTYHAGDALRSIAWKASARRDQLISRTWEAAHGDDVELDWHAIRLPHEARIRRLAHWVELAEREGRRWRLRLPQLAPIGPASGADHRHECLRALALMPEDAGV